MKKKNRSLYKQLNSVILYRDDIEKIIEILETGDGEVSLENEDYEFNSLNDIETIKRDFITILKIYQSNPSVSIKFSGNGVSLFAYENTPISIGIYEQIKNYILSRKRKITYLTESSILSGACIGISPYPIIFSLSFSLYKILLSVFIFTLGILWSWNAFQVSNKRYSIIFPHINRKERFGLFHNKKDEIWIAIIAAGFGALFAIIIKEFIDAI